MVSFEAPPSAAMTDEIEKAVTDAVATMLRRRARLLRARASVGVRVVDGYRRPVVVRSGESAAAFRIARDFDAIGDEVDRAA